MEELSESFICSCAQCWYLCHYSNSLGWFRSRISCHMAQGMRGNADASGLSLYLRAGRTPQMLNKHLHRSLQVNQESQPSLTPFQACKVFFFYAFSLSEGVYIRIPLKFKILHLPPSTKNRGTKEALKTLNMQIIECFHM